MAAPFNGRNKKVLEMVPSSFLPGSENLLQKISQQTNRALTLALALMIGYQTRRKKRTKQNKKYHTHSTEQRANYRKIWTPDLFCAAILFTDKKKGEIPPLS